MESVPVMEEMLFFSLSDLPGWTIQLNSMEADFDPATEEFDRDLLQARFPNGCLLDLAWNGPRKGQRGEFTVALVQTPKPCFEPFAWFACSSISELKSFVTWCAGTAAKRASIRRHLFPEWKWAWHGYTEPDLDELVLDPLAPLATQIDALKPLMFVVLKCLNDELIYLTVGWIPAHQVPGEFVVRTYEDHPDRWALNEDRDSNEPEYPCRSWNLRLERRCASIVALREVVQTIIVEW